jgi:hypothetical protein
VGRIEGGIQVQFPAVVNETFLVPEILGFTLTPIYELVDISPGVKGQDMTFTSSIPCMVGWSSNSAWGQFYFTCVCRFPYRVGSAMLRGVAFGIDK